MKRFSLICFFLSFLLISGQAQEFKQLHGKAVQKNVKQILKQISWKADASFKDLKEEAQAQKKMIFWLQLVGKLDDGL